MSANAPEKKAVKDLSHIMCLDPPAQLPCIENDQISTPRWEELIQAGLISSIEDEESSRDGSHRAGPKKFHAKAKYCVVDLLGVYLPRQNKIIVYDELVRLSAKRLKIKAKDLHDVVLLHELAHQVTHKGRDSEGDIWESFATAAAVHRKRVEYFAQIYAYKMMRMREWSNGLGILATLSRLQSSAYRAYEASIRLPMRCINRDLMEERRKKIRPIDHSHIPEIPVKENRLEKCLAIIDVIEREIAEYQRANKDYDSTMFQIAEKLGKRKAYEKLLKQMDELIWAEERHRPISDNTC